MLGLGTNRRKTAQRSRAGDDETGVKDPRRIARVLTQVVEARTLLNVRDASGASHVSTLLEVDLDGGSVTIDEPGTGSIAIGSPLQVSARVEGVLVRFSSRVIAHGADAGGGLYRLAFPARVERHQRRAHHRAPVTSALPVSVTFAHEDGTTTLAEVRDLSAGGLCARLPADAGWPGADGPVPCTVRLGEDAEIQCALEVRRHQEMGSVDLIGGRFVGLEPRDLLTLERFVAGLEREALRKRRG